MNSHSGVDTGGAGDSVTAEKPVITRYAGLWMLAALLPVAASAMVFVDVDAAPWSMSAATKRALQRDALLYTVVAVVLLAPLAGVIVAAAGRARRERRGPSEALEGAWSLVVTAAIFVTSSAALAVFGWDAGADGLGLVATSHATMFAVALALAGFGALCGATFTDSLDAAGCSLCIVVVAAAGLLVAGAALVNVPRALIDVALAASPLITMASAAHIDVMRMDLPYQMSPLAHLEVHYLSWYVACAWYLALAGLCFLGVNWQARSWQSMSVRLKGQMA